MHLGIIKQALNGYGLRAKRCIGSGTSHDDYECIFFLVERMLRTEVKKVSI